MHGAATPTPRRLARLLMLPVRRGAPWPSG